MKAVTGVIFTLIIIFFINVTIVGQETKDLLINDNEISGWVFDADSIPCNTGVANDNPSLFDAIDGGAEVYLDRGFVSGAYSGYTDGTPDNEICVEIYDQGTAANAYLVYQYFDNVSSVNTYIDIPDLGDSAQIDTCFLVDYVLEVIKDNYFLRFVCRKDDPSKQSMISFAQRVVEKSVPIIHNPDNLKLKNSYTNISVFPSNGNFLFKITLRANYFEKSKVPELSIYNSKGLLIQKLGLRPFGSENYIALWDGKNKSGKTVAKGVYTAVIDNKRMFSRQNFVIGY